MQICWSSLCYTKFYLISYLLSNRFHPTNLTENKLLWQKKICPERSRFWITLVIRFYQLEEIWQIEMVRFLNSTQINVLSKKKKKKYTSTRVSLEVQMSFKEACETPPAVQAAWGISECYWSSCNTWATKLHEAIEKNACAGVSLR